MVALGIEKPGKIVEATVGTNLYNGFTSVTNIVFAFGMFPLQICSSTPILISPAGHAAFFGFMAELKDARDFPKALIMLQSIDVSLYVVAAVVIYRYAGPDVASPALGSAGPVLSKVAYGIALPTVSSSPAAATNNQLN